MNSSVETTLRQFQDMEQSASPQTLRNWRFQQALWRAYYDAYTYRRLLFESSLEKQALQVLEQAEKIGTTSAISQARKILHTFDSVAAPFAWRERIHELSAALFQSIGMQLSVEKYKAIAVDRGAALDTLEYPLNDRPWLVQQFDRIGKLPTEAERLKAIGQIVHWEDPGPGGFYDDLGNSARQPHLVQGLGFSQDPGSMRSPRNGFEEDLAPDEDEPPPQGIRRAAWRDHAESLFDAPLEVKYSDLDPSARYRVRVVYAGDAMRRKIRLVANGSTEIHSYLERPVPYRPIEFDIPPEATAGGKLTLTWYGEAGLGGNGRGCQVSELWLMRSP